MSLSNDQLGAGGSGMHGRGKGTAAAKLLALEGLQVKLVAGAAANTALPLAIDSDDQLISVLNNNAGTLTDVTAQTTIVDTRASGTVTLGAAGTAGDTVSVAGLTYTLASAAAKIEPHNVEFVRVGADATATAAALAKSINAREGNRGAKVSATAAAGVVTIKAVQGGTAGNALALAETGNSMTISGATLEGGTATTGLKVSVVTNQLQVFYFKKP